jgi:hypothetical protein
MAVRRRLAEGRDRLSSTLIDRLERHRDRQWDQDPLCAAPLATDDEYRRRWEQACRECYPAIDAAERACGAAIDREWFEELALRTQVTIKQSPLCYQHGRVLYAILRRYLRERQSHDVTIVETGTARGFSALCLARALDDAGASGRIATFDVLPHDQPIYWNCLGDEQGRRTRAQVLAPYTPLVERFVVFHRGDTRTALRAVSFPRVHLAFFDSVHTFEHLHAEFDAVRGRQRAGDLAVFDDYVGYPGVARAADEICARDGYTATVITARPGRGYAVAQKQ